MTVPALHWQPDVAALDCEHALVQVQAKPGEPRVNLEARAILDHMLATLCNCSLTLIGPHHRQALHDETHRRGATCRAGKDLHR